LASAGDARQAPVLEARSASAHGFVPQYRVDWISQPVVPTEVPLDDFYDAASPQAPASGRALGQVVMVFSRQAVDDQKLNLLMGGGLIVLLALLFGIALALRLSLGVLRPVARLSRLAAQIGRGEFAEVQAQRALVSPDDPLRDLQWRIHQMSDQLWAARDDLQQQVDRATQALRQKKEEAESANLAKGRFLAAASHDLRQPTHALGLFVSRLAQLEHNELTWQVIRNLEASVQALQNLLDGLLDISRLEARAVSVKRQPFALAESLRALSVDLGELAREKGLVLQVRHSDAWVDSDATLVYRILLNLVNNAIRYTEHGRILVAARRRLDSQQVWLQVWDTGVGIALEHQEAVFGEFFQVANATRDRTKGMGLGLSIVRRTAELLGHEVTLRSRVGAGTCVTLKLPLCQAPAQALSAPTAEEATPGSLAQVRVLVIEDDTLVRSALVTVLQGWGMRVAQADAWAPAQQLVAQGMVPDLIISDFRLPPPCNGIEAISRLRTQLQSPVPACLISGDMHDALLAQAQAAGLVLLQKPVRAAKLRSLLRRLMVQGADGPERP